MPFQPANVLLIDFVISFRILSEYYYDMVKIRYLSIFLSWEGEIKNQVILYHMYSRELVVDSVIQAIGTVKYEDGRG